VKAVFRVDASTQIGTGHFVRCRTLALALREQGAAVEFICRDHPGHLMDWLAQDDIPVTALPPPAETPPAGEDYAAWLGVPQDEDARQTIGVIGGAQPDWLIMDHYGLDAAWERQLRPHCGRLFVIDDLANRPHGCDVLLDHNYFANPAPRYNGLVPEHCLRLLGPRYALLRPEYGVYRRGPAPRDDVRRVLVFFGGSDLRNATGLALQALSEPEFCGWQVDAVVSPNNPHRAQLMLIAAHRENTHIHSSRPHLADLMASADIGIGAGGTTTWERLCAGLPSLVISVADNQGQICRELSEAGLIRYMGEAEHVTAPDIAAQLKRIQAELPDVEMQRLNGQLAVDGLGVKRILDALMPPPANSLKLRAAAASDMLLYFGWANDPAVRENSLNQERISLADHRDWFYVQLADTDTHLFVLEARGLPVGQIRFQCRKGVARINYSADAAMRGRGWGGELVRLGIERMRDIAPISFSAEVKSSNPASAAVFRRLGFVEEDMRQAGIHFFTLAAGTSQGGEK
jgi:UDP-2,4-diacetamido-2,4,6-trideoxy-beta-L-altropyranose hydrolase